MTTLSSSKVSGGNNVVEAYRLDRYDNFEVLAEALAALAL